MDNRRSRRLRALARPRTLAVAGAALAALGMVALTAVAAPGGGDSTRAQGADAAAFRTFRDCLREQGVRPPGKANRPDRRRSTGRSRRARGTCRNTPAGGTS